MALAFKRVRLTISNESGRHVDSVGDAFGRDIKRVNNQPVAEVAVQSFKLDFAGGASAHPTDLLQVSVGIKGIGSDSFTVEYTINYTGGRYSGEVIALVIADLVDTTP
jgi:hypothetical protein